MVDARSARHEGVFASLRRVEHVINRLLKVLGAVVARVMTEMGPGKC